jgi:hypothetical protein
MFVYTGSGTRSYMDYCDLATDRMLVAEPGGTYGMRATWDKLPVPPGDGFWEEAPEADAVEAPEPAEAEVKSAPKGKQAKAAPEPPA